MSCMISEKGLDLDTAIRMLENIQDYITISQPPIKPKGGEVFIFLPESINEQENYKCDQYRWLNSGPKEIPRKNPLVKKQYFIGKLPQGKTQAFQKHCYVLVSDHRVPYPVLLHYIGDETVMVDYPHGNSKRSNSAYFAIAPSVRKDIANRSKCAMPTAIINSYKVAPSSSSFTVNENGATNVNPVLTPRNKSQVRNIRRKQKLSNIKQGIPIDDIGTLHSLGSELIGFAQYIRTSPDLICIVGLNDISNEVENLMKLNNNVVVFSFQESYKVGRYFITPFNFIHGAFSDLPTIPCFFLISEQCDFFIYERFLQTIIDCIPNLEHCQTAVITNQDYNFTSSLSISFPNWLQIYDWEILFVAARSFLRKLSTDTKDITMRIKQLKTLMSCESIEDYRLELERLKKEWPLAFCEYYIQVLQEPVEIGLGRWLLERYKLYSPHMGVIRGVNTDLQLVTKHLQELKDVSLDIILPSLYHLQIYIFVNIQKGFCGIGRYNLCSSFKFLARDFDELVLPCKVYEPSGIVKIFRVRGITMFSDSYEMSDEDNSLLQAQRILEMGNISHSTTLQAFLVKSTSGSLHGVQLFPRECCSCSINQRCAHIMAVMLALGMPLTYDKKGTIKMHKPQVGPTSTTDFLGEIMTQQIGQQIGQQICQTEIPTEITTDITTCEEVQDALTIVDATKDTATDMEIINDHVTATDASTDPSTTVQALEEITSVVSSDGTPAFTTMSAVYQGAESLIQVNSDQLDVSKNIVQVNSADFQSVLNGAHGNDVLMVVSNQHNGTGDKPILAYEVAQEAMLAYANQQFANVGIVGIAREDGTIVQQHNGTVDPEMAAPEEKQDVKIELEIPPEELILRMSEVMHKTTN